MDVVLSNLLATRETKIYVHDKRILENDITFSSGQLVEKTKSQSCLEEELIPILCSKHYQYLHSQ